MTWIEAFNRSSGYLPLVLVTYAVSWFIFSMATWVLLQAWQQDSLPWIFVAGGQFFAGVMIAAGGTIAIAVKVIGDTPVGQGNKVSTA